MRYRIDALPLWTCYCHCTTCRRSTGAPVTLFVGTAAASVTFAKGERIMFASSQGVERGFGASCGTPLTYEADYFPGEVHFYISPFDDPESLPPTLHVFHDERLR